MKDYIVLDLETTSLNPRQGSIIACAAFHSQWKEPKVSSNREEIQQWCSLPIAKVFHNAVFDLSYLIQHKYVVEGPYHDTMILAHLIDPDRETLKLKDLAVEYFSASTITHAKNIYDWLETNHLSKNDLYRAPKHLLHNYAMEDVLNTKKLYELFVQKLSEISKWQASKKLTTLIDYYTNEIMPLIEVIVQIELRGVKIDVQRVVDKQGELQLESKQLLEKLDKENYPYIKQAEDILYHQLIAKKQAKNKSGKLKKEPPRVIFNWNSNDHLKLLFFKLFNEKPTKKTLKGNLSINSDMLTSLLPKYPWISDLLKYKVLRKLSSTYLSNLLTMQEAGRIHASFHMCGTATGRFSSSNPNLQNLPKHGNIKSLFIPAPNNIFVYADYSQLELRLAAHLSQDSLLLKAYKDNLDLHQLTADIIGVDRALGKTINFAIIYNASGWRIAEILGYMSNIDDADVDGKREAAKKGDEIIRELFGHYKGLQNYLENTKRFMLQYNIAVSPFGRIRRLKNLSSSTRKEFNHGIKQGFNFGIQSMGASICKRAMIELYRNKYQIVNQVHDSIVIEIPDNKEQKQQLAKIQFIMENIAKLSVPLIAAPKILTSFEEKI